MTIAMSCGFIDRFTFSGLCIPTGIDLLLVPAILLAIGAYLLHQRRGWQIKSGLLLVLALTLVIPPFLSESLESTGGGGYRESDTNVNTISCYTHKGNGETGVIMIDISNTGQTALDLNPVTFTVRMPDGDINYTLSHLGVSFAPEAVNASTRDGIAILRTGGENEWPAPSSYVIYQINATKPVKLQKDVPYSITIELNDMGHTISTTCQAEPP
ncbi:MAG: hypothetical protein SVU32_08945 [Candidatus Nanohaloarchaea archaeon]|nr:hypothetical protein [Candidatus Nanohaloarchaea archaeon]